MVTTTARKSVILIKKILTKMESEMNATHKTTVTTMRATDAMTAIVCKHW